MSCVTVFTVTMWRTSLITAFIRTFRGHISGFRTKILVFLPGKWPVFILLMDLILASLFAGVARKLGSKHVTCF